MDVYEASIFLATNRYANEKHEMEQDNTSRYHNLVQTFFRVRNSF